MSLTDKAKQVTNRLLGRSSTGGKTLDNIDDEIVDEAIETLETMDEEVSRENIERQANYLLEIEDEDDEEKFKVGFIQDRSEAEVTDQNVVSPNAFSKEVSPFNRGYIKRNEKFVRILVLTGYPRYLAPGALLNLYTTHADIRITQHIDPLDAGTILSKFQRRLNRTMARLSRKRQKQKYDTQEEEEETQTLEAIIWQIITGETKLFHQSVYLEIVADSKRQLDQDTTDVLNVLSRYQIDAESVRHKHPEAQQALSPAAQDPLGGNKQTMQARTLSTMFPFVGPETVDPNGIYYGKDREGKPVFFDPYTLSGYVELLIGKMGAGKTFAKIWEILLIRYQNPDYPVWVIDPQQDFGDFARSIGGTVVELGGDTTINPLEIQQTSVENIDDPYEDKIRTILGMYRQYFGDEMDRQLEGHITRIAHLAYLKYGITPDSDTHHKDPPIIQDHIEIARQLSDRNPPTEFLSLEPSARENEEEIWERIAAIQSRMLENEDEYASAFYNALESFQEGGVNSSLNGHTNVDLSNSLVVFDMSMYADSKQAPLMMHVVFDLIYQECMRTDDPDMVVCEEAHYLMGSDSLNLLNIFVRHHRHSKTRISLLTQTISEFLVNKDDANERTEIFETADLRRIFYQKRVTEEEREALSLTKPQADFIENAKQGEEAGVSECLFSGTGLGKIQLTVNTPEYEEHLIDSDKSAWEFLYDQGTITPDDLQDMVNEHLHLKYNIPHSLLAKAGVRLPTGETASADD